MSWFRQHLGLDGVALLIQGGVTAAIIWFVARTGGPEEMLPVILGFSLIVLGIRRTLALRDAERRGLSTGEMAAERIAELEQRMADLEEAQARVAELEERLDFAERLLAKAAGEQRVLPGGNLQ